MVVADTTRSVITIAIPEKELSKILAFQAQSPTKVLSCNESKEVFVPLKRSYSEDERYYLTGLFPKLEQIVREVLTVELQGGRFKVRERDVIHVASNKMVCQLNPI